MKENNIKEADCNTIKEQVQGGGTLLRKTSKRALTIRYLKRVCWGIWCKLYSKRVSDYKFLIKRYKKATNRTLNLKNPRRYTEKLQWLKLFYRDTLIERCSDKASVKNYLSEIGYADMAVKTLALYNSVDEIDIRTLPNKFVMKATHGSGWNLICLDKSTLDWKSWKRLFKVWHKQNPHWFGREWNYKNIQPRILVEEYLEDDSGELRDYKVFCMNGQAKFMQIDENRNSNHKRKYYDKNGNLLNMKDSQSHDGELKVVFGKNQYKMFELAEKLCKPFPSVRIDFYEFSDKLYIGEFTFFDGSGFFTFNPDETDYEWGDLLQLPNPNNNLELYNKIQNGKKDERN